MEHHFLQSRANDTPADVKATSHNGDGLSMDAEAEAETAIGTPRVKVCRPSEECICSDATGPQFQSGIPNDTTTTTTIHPVVKSEMDFLIEESYLSEDEIRDTNFFTGADDTNVDTAIEAEAIGSTVQFQPNVSFSFVKKIEELEEEIKKLKNEISKNAENTVVGVVEETANTNLSGAAGSSTNPTAGGKTETADEILNRICTKGQTLREDKHPPKLPPYDASAMSLKTWVDALLEVFGAYPNLPRGVAVSQVILALKEPLLSSFLMTVDADKNKQKSITELLRAFCETSFIENKAVDAQLFSRRYQLPEETAEQYGNVLFTLARSAFSKTDSNDSLFMRVFHQFITGLREPIGSCVRMQLPADYRQAVQLAMVIEDEHSRNHVNVVHESTSLHTQQTAHDIEVETASHTPSNHETRRCFQCQEVGHIQRNCTKPRPLDYLDGHQGPQPHMF